MKNIQVIDGAENATYSIYEVSDEQFACIFPGFGQDIEVVEDYVSRVGETKAAQTLSSLWLRPIHKRLIAGIHGTLFYEYEEKRKYLPKSKRELDRDLTQLNEAERELYRTLRARNDFE